jgi:uncharacterized lipoprotein NlpE involved in copper resistance
MRKKIIYSFSLLMAVLIIPGLGSCSSNRTVDIHNSRNSVDWDGAYSGIIPSADGSGINVLIILNRDETFVLRYSYVDLPDNLFTNEGSFKWDNAGSVIILEVEDWPPYYRVGQNQLTQLDMEGKVITGGLAEDYVLKKILPD